MAGLPPADAMTRHEKNDEFLLTSFLYGGNAAYIDDLYARFKTDPSSVDPTWATFFGRLEDSAQDARRNTAGPSWARADWPQAANGELVSALDGNWGDIAVKTEKALKTKAAAEAKGGEAPAPVKPEDVHQATRDSIHAIMMIRAYRMRGHLHADLDPLKLKADEPAPELDPKTYGFMPADYDRKIFIDNYLGVEFATVPEMLAILQRTYCSTVGVEFMHISDPESKQWIQERIEGPDKEITFTAEGKKAILNKLVEAEGFEKFLDVKYTGTKRFGLDGGEALIPALEQIIKRGGALGVKDIVFGMAHRGRLNVLTQVIGKPHRALFHEFKGGSFYPEEVEGSGDVKYHLGASADREFDSNTVHLSLTANPSHLEIVDPVVLGKARAKQDQHLAPEGKLSELPQQGSRVDRSMVLPLLIHGDAAFAGQGVVAECLGLSGLRGHRTGGSIHVVINNQIGFTTAPMYSRSSPYPTDVAKMIEAPVFHVNGDDPEAVVFVAKVATEYRQKFGRPVVIDMFCYRRFGHNEGDEPSFTQPLMYAKIRAHKTTLELYSDKLVGEGLVTREDVDALKAEWRSKLETEFEGGQDFKPNKADWLDGQWKDMRTAEAEGPRRGQTGVEMDQLVKIGTKLNEVPSDLQVHRTVKRFLDNRLAAVQAGEGIDWALAEALAFGTLVTENHPVRLSGQDVERGTFSQRHTVLYDQQADTSYTPLNNLEADQCRYEVINSMLSEEAVLGFEYGYSLAEPKALTLWEAQFGDFANGAQVVIDQFISGGERKWFRMSGLVMLLPHGYEGQGPEHSSARLERYLQLCAEDNLQVANCTTPANYFHILRRQVKRDFRKPLILMTPKSLLRHKRAVSGIAEFGPDSCFHRLLWDDAEAPGTPKTTIKLAPDNAIRRVVLCSGKVYYDLLEDREKRGLNDVYLLRVEQLYPFPAKAVLDELSRFPSADVVWAQEEPKNMGAWAFVQPYLDWLMDQLGRSGQRPRYVGRPASASTATGLMRTHLAQLATLLEEAFGK